MSRILRRVLVVAALLGAWAYAGAGSTPLTLAEASSGPYAERDSSSETGAKVGGEKSPHDLTQLRIFHKVILFVKDNYVDPKRVHPKEMMVQALEYVEKTVPEVMVEGTAESGKLRVNVSGKVKDFDISKVDSLWKMSFNIKDVFDFIAQNMRPIDDTRDIEYAAINGMLSTLDPHSVLLRPDIYREMKLTTKGEFGGLGFVIQMKEGNLTVVRVLAKTPAARAGIKKDDQIKKIGEESTVNMDLGEAVSKLRGPVDSKIVITVDRKGFEHPQPMTLARAMISVESVQSKLLTQNVGYVRLKNFQGNTTRDLQLAIAEMTKQSGQGGLKGLVLDMRGNPGGLLEQAIQVSDLFLSQGVIVATVGFSDRMREEKRAHADEGDNLYPIAVLVNAGSASASEIVAGALKNLNRAVIIGQQTFGKGSVQVLYDFAERNNDESALKLTIAKYLTPGDISIQEVGIVPDIALLPTRVTQDRVNVFAQRKAIGEADLEHHFGNPSNATAVKKREEVIAHDKPSDELRYLKEDTRMKDASARQQKEEEGKSPKLSRKDSGGQKKGGVIPILDADPDTGKLDEDLYDQLDAETQDEVKEDFEVLFARDYVLKAPFVQREKMIVAGRGFVDQKRKEEQERISKAITALNVDWTPGATPKNISLAATVKPTADRKILAGSLLELEVTAENKGTEPLRRVRAWTESDNPLLDRREFLFGSLKPGEKRTWKVPVKLPKDLTSRRDDVTVKFFDDHGALPDTEVAELNFVELPRPAFAFNWQVLDDCATCNGDGIAQRGEDVTLLVDVTNTGTGKAMDAYGYIKNAADQNIFINKGRFHLGEVGPGETKTARFSLDVKKGYVGTSFPLKVFIQDEPLEEVSSEKLRLDVGDKPLEVESHKGTVKVAEGASVYGAPTEKSPALAKLPKGATLTELGRVNGFTKVELDKGRFVFVKAVDAKEIAHAKAAYPKDAAFETFRDPPQIALNVDTNQGGILASGDKFTLSGTVTEPKGLLDMYVLVNDQKVFFRTAEPGKGEPTKVKFTAECPLKDGNNYIVVVARETPDFAARKAVVVRKRPAAVAQAMAQSLKKLGMEPMPVEATP